MLIFSEYMFYYPDIYQRFIDRMRTNTVTADYNISISLDVSNKLGIFTSTRTCEDNLVVSFL